MGHVHKEGFPIRTLLNHLRKILSLILIFTLLLGFAGLLFLEYQKYRIRSDYAIRTDHGIQSLEPVILGGTPQWISIRGNDSSNPVLLFLSGGPGGSSLPHLRHFNSELEEYFTVVNWDQRGAGKSYSPAFSQEDMSMDQFVDDVLELSQLLADRFATEKIYLCGHSWGTVIGLKAADARPDLYHAYIGIAQVVNPAEGEALSYAFTLAAAQADGNRTGVAEIEDIGPPPYALDEDFWTRITTQRRWLFHYGGSVYSRTDLFPPTFNLYAPEYTLADFLILKRANRTSVTFLWDELLAVNLSEEIPVVQVPVYFMTGRHDQVVPAVLTEHYVQALKAPYKKLIWFEESAHSPLYEEPERFNQIMVQTVLHTRSD